MFNVKLVVVRGSCWQRMRDWMEIIAKRHPLGWTYSIGLRKVPPPKHIHGDHRRRASTLTRAGAHHHARSTSGVPGTPPPMGAADILLAQRALGNARQQSPPIDVFDPEDYLESGENIKLVVLAKHFSADFREGWELYRTEYWERENERRAKEVEAIKTSLEKTGQLPPMNSNGVIMAAGISGTSGGTPAFPGISGRPARKPSVSNPAEPITTRPRAKSNASSGDPDATIRGTVVTSSSTTGVKPKQRTVRKKSGTLLHPSSAIEDSDSSVSGRKPANQNVRSLRGKPSNLTGSSTESLANSSDDGGFV